MKLTIVSSKELWNIHNFIRQAIQARESWEFFSLGSRYNGFIAEYWLVTCEFEFLKRR